MNNNSLHFATGSSPNESIPAPMLAASRVCVLQCLTRLVGAQHHADRQTLYDLACEAQLAQIQAENPDLPPHMCEDCLQYGGFTAALDETLNRLPDLCQEAGFVMRAPTPAEQLLYGLQSDEPCCFAKAETQAEPQPEPSVEKVTVDCHALEALYAVSRPLGKESQQPDQWPELDEGCLPAFPVELLPAPYGKFAVQVAASVHAPVDFAAAALLGTASSALTGRVFVEIKKHFVKPVQQYLGLIGSSGSGKSPVMSIMADPLRDCLHERCCEFKALNIDRGVMGQEPLPEPETICTDIPPEALLSVMNRQGGKGIIFAEEGSIANILTGSTYGSKGSQTNIDVFLSGSDGAQVSCNRVGLSEPIHIRHAHLSMTIALQPGILDSFAKNPSLSDRGLPQRFLYFVGEPLGPYSVYNEPEISDELLDMWSATVRRLDGAFRDGDKILPLSEDARMEYLAFKQCMVNRVSEDLGESSEMCGWTSKAHEKAARLALLLAMLRDSSADQVEQCDVRAACRMMNEYFIPHVKMVYGQRTGLTPEAQAVLRAMKVLAKAKEHPVAESAITRKVGRQRQFKVGNQAVLIRKAMEELWSKGYIRPAELPKASTGRPSLGAWELHPDLIKKE